MSRPGKPRVVWANLTSEGDASSFNYDSSYRAETASHSGFLDFSEHDGELRRSLFPDMAVQQPEPGVDLAILEINEALVKFYQDTATDRFFELWPCRPSIRFEPERKSILLIKKGGKASKPVAIASTNVEYSSLYQGHREKGPGNVEASYEQRERPRYDEREKQRNDDAMMRSEEKRLKDKRALEDSRRIDENSRSLRGDDRRMDRRDERDRERDSRRVDERDRRADDRDREINNSFNNSSRRNYYEKERRSERTEEKEKRYGPREELRPVQEPKRAAEREIPKPKAEPLVNFVSEAAKMKLNETASMKEAKRGWESDYGMFSEREEQHAGSGEFDFEWTKNYHTPSVVIQDKEDASVLNDDDVSFFEEGIDNENDEDDSYYEDDAFARPLRHFTMTNNKTITPSRKTDPMTAYYKMAEKPMAQKMISPARKVPEKYRDRDTRDTRDSRDTRDTRDTKDTRGRERERERERDMSPPSRSVKSTNNVVSSQKFSNNNSTGVSVQPGQKLVKKVPVKKAQPKEVLDGRRMEGRMEDGERRRIDGKKLESLSIQQPAIRTKKNETTLKWVPETSETSSSERETTTATDTYTYRTEIDSTLTDSNTHAKGRY